MHINALHELQIVMFTFFKFVVFTFFSFPCLCRFYFLNSCYCTWIFFSWEVAKSKTTWLCVILEMCKSIQSNCNHEQMSSVAVLLLCKCEFQAVQAAYKKNQTFFLPHHRMCSYLADSWLHTCTYSNKMEAYILVFAHDYAWWKFIYCLQRFGKHTHFRIDAGSLWPLHSYFDITCTTCGAMTLGCQAVPFRNWYKIKMHALVQAKGWI